MTNESSPQIEPETPETLENQEKAKKPKMKRLTPQEKLAKIKARVLTLEARASSITAKEATKARKLDTHRKAIFGGAMFALHAQQQETSWHTVCEYIKANSTTKQREAVADLL